MLNKTLIEQLNNCYIDCSYSKSDNTIIVNIDTPNTKGSDVLEPFTIRTKDGYSLKYDDKTGNVVYRINKKYLPSSTGEDEVNQNYDLYFDDYNFNLQTLSTYENTDPVIQFITPTYAKTEGDHSIAVPRFEYADIEKQKENIFLIDTGIKSKDSKSELLPQTLYSLPNGVKDEYNITTGKGIQRIGRVVFGDIDTPITRDYTGTSGKYRFMSVPKFPSAKATTVADKQIVSDKVASGIAGATYSLVCVTISSTDNGAIYCYLEETSEMSLSDAKIWFSNNPITVLYELATPIEFTGATGLGMTDNIIYGETTQKGEGTPTLTNVRELSGISSKDSKAVFIASYYGKDTNKCKLELLEEVESDGEPSYMIKTASGKMFKFLIQSAYYGANPFGEGRQEVVPIVSISANAEQVGEIIEEDNTKGLFSTYVVNQAELNNISNTGEIYSEIIINTFSYPIKFNDDDLLEVNIKIGNTPIEDIKGRKFKRAEPKIKVFTFNVPYLKDVETCKLLLPFNTEIILDYDVIRGKTINGYIQYEVSTNSSTLYIDNEDVTFFKDIVVIETVVPYKPTGEYVGFKESQKRLGKQTPILLIKCLQEEYQHHFIKGFINYQITGILKDELSLLNEELQKGVITNE